MIVFQRAKTRYKQFLESPTPGLDLGADNTSGRYWNSNVRHKITKTWSIFYYIRERVGAR